MKAVSNFPVLKVLSTFMFVLLMGSFAFSYKIYNDANEAKKMLTNQKNDLIKDLQKSKDSLEIAIVENSSLKTELIIERQKVTNLLDEINTSNINIEGLLKYKNQVADLKNVIAKLSKDKKELKRNNDLLKNQRDSTILVLNKAKENNEKLSDLNFDLNRTIKKANGISVINLRSTPFKVSKKGDLEETDKASRVNLIQVSFIVIGSKIGKPCDKDYYVQIIDAKNNIVGDRKTKKFGPMILDYSYATSVRFKNESLEVVADLSLGEDMEKGMYYVNIFDKGDLASKTTFSLR